jgi:hypothetical protein
MMHDFMNRRCDTPASTESFKAIAQKAHELNRWTCKRMGDSVFSANGFMDDRFRVIHSSMKCGPAEVTARR